ncbi:hypothetical protein V8G54_026104 [Vigna mungo]|uniref:Uncharacterized protein n=1 Tax=Vigna mungo TaxID=3915 RepID=A0AAQ3N067_VIGMU
MSHRFFLANHPWFLMCLETSPNTPDFNLAQLIQLHQCPQIHIGVFHPDSVDISKHLLVSLLKQSGELELLLSPPVETKVIKLASLRKLNRSKLAILHDPTDFTINSTEFTQKRVYFRVNSEAMSRNYTNIDLTGEIRYLKPFSSTSSSSFPLTLKELPATYPVYVILRFKASNLTTHPYRYHSAPRTGRALISNSIDAMSIIYFHKRSQTPYTAGHSTRLTLGLKYSTSPSYLSLFIILLQEKNIQRLNELVRHLQEQLQQCRGRNGTINGTVSPLADRILELERQQILED